MDKKLQRLETFRAEGSDGQVHVVHGFEHLVRLDGMPDLEASWQATGVAEYKLAGGEPLQVLPDGTLRVVGGELVLRRTAAEAAAA